jgi:transcription elongation factor Elf1
MRIPGPERMQCPHCGEVIDIPVETDGAQGSYIIDCSVCCRPIIVQVEIADDGLIRVSVERESD